MATHTDQKIELLKKVPLLSELGRRELEEVGRLADEVDLPANHVLMRQGSSGAEFYVIVDGKVRIERDGKDIATLGPGDFLGEIALVSDGPRTATATLESPAKLLVVGHREFHSLMEQFPSIRTCVLESLARKVRRLDLEAAH
jgi:CRP-like cAMP-binding protein